MKSTNTYLIFDGECRKAMEFYKKALGGELRMFTFGEMPPSPGCEVPAGAQDRIMHAMLESGPLVLMASDNMPGQPFTKGNNFQINLNCENEAEVDKLFKALSEGGHAIMPPGETFWAKRFGMASDKFGVIWMFNLEKPMDQHQGSHGKKPETVNA